MFSSLPTCETFVRDLEQAGLRRQTPDGVLTMTSLRKSLATDLDRQGVSEAMRQKLMRHETAGLTNRVYTRYGVAEMARELERITLFPDVLRPLPTVTRILTVEAVGEQKPSDAPEVGSRPSFPLVPISIDRCGSSTTVEGVRKQHQGRLVAPSQVGGGRANLVPCRDKRPLAGVAELADALDSGASAAPAEESTRAAVAAPPSSPDTGCEQLARALLLQVGDAEFGDALLLLAAAESLFARQRDAGLVRRLAVKAARSSDPLSFIRAAKWILSFPS